MRTVVSAGCECGRPDLDWENQAIFSQDRSTCFSPASTIVQTSNEDSPIQEGKRWRPAMNEQDIIHGLEAAL